MLGITEAGQDVSFAEMARRQQVAAAEVVARDPAVAGDLVQHRRRAGRADRQQRPALDHAEAVRRARPTPAQQVIARLRPQVAEDRGHERLLPAGAGHQRRRPAGAVRSTNTRSRTPTWPSCTSGRRRSSSKHARAADAARRGDRPAGGRHDGDADHRPRPGRAVRHPAAGDRRHALRRVRPAADRPVLHPAQLLQADPGSAAGDAGRPGHAGQAVREVAGRRRPCRSRPSSRSTRSPVRAAGDLATRASSRR